MNNDLISRSALLDAMPKNDELLSFEVRRVICNAPAVDAEVVRCKDCMHTTRSKVNPEKIICCLTLMCGTTEPDFFCAHGKHKMNAEVEG